MVATGAAVVATGAAVVAMGAAVVATGAAVVAAAVATESIGSACSWWHLTQSAHSSLSASAGVLQCSDGQRAPHGPVAIRSTWHWTQAEQAARVGCAAQSKPTAWQMAWHGKKQCGQF